MLPERANTAGAWLAGVTPHREAGGAKVQNAGKSAGDMLSSSMDRFLLVGAELEYDAADPSQAIKALQASSGVVAINAYLSPSIAAHADVVLPMATFTETYGTYVNAAGVWQTAKGVIAPPGDARPAWKILRVLADELDLSGFDYNSPETITGELQSKCSSVELGNMTRFDSVPRFTPQDNAPLVRAGETPIYATDPVVRRSQPLQKSLDGKQAFASMSVSELTKIKASDGDSVVVKQNGASVTLPCRADDNVPDGCVWVPSGLVETQELGATFGPIEVRKA